MKPVDQTTFGAKEGNCFAACLASVLELPIEKVPNFCVSSDWQRLCNAWLAQFGLMFFEAHWSEGAPPELWRHPVIQPGQLWIATGPAERDGQKLHHAVVMRGARMVHDPNPRHGRNGIEKVLGVGFLIEIEPRSASARGTRLEQSPQCSHCGKVESG